jgi:hypothetical protein
MPNSHHIYLSAQPRSPFAPLDALTILADRGATVVVTDGAGREYFRAPANGAVALRVGGAAGTHTVTLLDNAGKPIEQIPFAVAAETKIEDDGGEFADLLDILKNTMELYKPHHGEGVRQWRGKKYPFFIPWILDHEHTAKGMQFFSSATPGLVELLAELQREDGMIWSFVHDHKNAEADYFLTHRTSQRHSFPPLARRRRRCRVGHGPFSREQRLHRLRVPPRSRRAHD